MTYLKKALKSLESSRADSCVKVYKFSSVSGIDFLSVLKLLLMASCPAVPYVYIYMYICPA